MANDSNGKDNSSQNKESVCTISLNICGECMLTLQSQGSQNGTNGQQGKDSVSPFNLPAPTPGGLSPPPYHKRKK